MPDRERDTTNWCDHDNHRDCDGVLRAMTGPHWWCACECHPEPPATPAATAPAADHQLALATWQQARAARQETSDA